MARPARAAFIHVGLGKCASTYLQSLWMNEPRHACANVLQPARAARQAASSEPTGAIPPLRIDLRPRAGQSLVVTSEGLTWGYLNQPGRQKYLPQLHAVSAAMLAAAGLSDTILVIVRNPRDWIRAAHEQAIKEGGWDSAAEFVSRQRGLIEGVLDLRSLLDAFSPRFRKIIILSSDELRADPGTFWTRYEKSTGVSRPGARTVEAVNASDATGNTSLRDRLGFLAGLNRSTTALSDAYAAAELPDFAQTERQQLYPELVRGTRWASRRLAENADEETIERLSGHFQVDVTPDFLDFEIDAGLREHVLTRFVDPLAEHAQIDADMIAGYRDSLAETMAA